MAGDVTDRDQPNSFSSGSIRAPVELRNAAAAIKAQKVIAATHQARWIRGSVRTSWPIGVTEP
jgi:hypothetical protein